MPCNPYKMGTKNESTVKCSFQGGKEHRCFLYLKWTIFDEKVLFF